VQALLGFSKQGDVMAVNRIFGSVGPQLLEGRERFAHPTRAAVSIQTTGIRTPGVQVVLIGLAGVTHSQVSLQQQLYQMAYEQARQALEPPRHLRQFSVWN
jgi:hypothetical protein